MQLNISERIADLKQHHRYEKILNASFKNIPRISMLFQSKIFKTLTDNCAASFLRERDDRVHQRLRAIREVVKLKDASWPGYKQGLNFITFFCRQVTAAGPIAARESKNHKIQYQELN